MSTEPQVFDERLRGVIARWVARLLPVVVLAVLVVLGATACGEEVPRVATVRGIGTTVDFDFTIPIGTAARIARGEDVRIVPRRIDARVGQVIRIRNDDVHGHALGPFYIAAGSTLTQRFLSPGAFRGTCSVHPNGAVRLLVRA